MNIECKPSRDNCLQIISNAETEQIVNASIEHFVIPLIAGMSLDGISQAEYQAMGGQGNKPAPLSMEKKMAIYNKLQDFLKPKILKKAAELVNSVIHQSFASISDEEICIKATALTKKSIEVGPKWDKLPLLFENHTCLFEELQNTSNLKANLISFHDTLCPIMCKYGDSGKLFHIIRLELD